MCVEFGWYLEIVYFMEVLVECHDIVIIFLICRLVMILINIAVDKALDVFLFYVAFKMPRIQNVQHLQKVFQRTGNVSKWKLLIQQGGFYFSFTTLGDFQDTNYKRLV